MLGSSPLGLAFLWLLPIRSVTCEARAGWEAGEDEGRGRDTSVLVDEFAVLSVWEWGTFPSRAAPDPFETRQCLCSCSALHLPGRDHKVQRPGCHGSSGTAGRDKALAQASCATGWLRPGEEEKVAVFSLSNHLNFIVMIVFI